MWAISASLCGDNKTILQYDKKHNIEFKQTPFYIPTSYKIRDTGCNVMHAARYMKCGNSSQAYFANCKFRDSVKQKTSKLMCG
jgi:hypothetical protein